MHLTESSFASSSAYRSSFEGNHQGFHRPGMTLTMHTMNEIGTKLKPVIVTSKRDAEVQLEPLFAYPDFLIHTNHQLTQLPVFILNFYLLLAEVQHRGACGLAQRFCHHHAHHACAARADPRINLRAAAGTARRVRA
jgi:hypothetical protein